MCREGEIRRGANSQVATAIEYGAKLSLLSLRALMFRPEFNPFPCHIPSAWDFFNIPGMLADGGPAPLTLNLQLAHI